MIKNSIKLLILVFGLMGCSMPLCAQRTYNPDRPLREIKDSVKAPKWEPHLSVSMGFLGSSYGDNRLFTSVAPSLSYRPNDRWLVSAGFRITSDMGFPFVQNNRDLAPYKREGGTGLASAHVAAEYRVNDNLWLAASVYHIGGKYAPFCVFAQGSTLDVSATAISAAAALRFNDDNYLRLSFTMIHDHYGTLPYMYFDSWMHSGFSPWGMYASPTDFYRMAAPFSPFYYDGIY